MEGFESQPARKMNRLFENRVSLGNRNFHTIPHFYSSWGDMRESPLEQLKSRAYKTI
jgi:hypothetical protein